MSVTYCTVHSFTVCSCIVSGGRGECYTLYSAFIYVLVYCEWRAR